MQMFNKWAGTGSRGEFIKIPSKLKSVVVTEGVMSLTPPPPPPTYVCWSDAISLFAKINIGGKMGPLSGKVLPTTAKLSELPVM